MTNSGLSFRSFRVRRFTHSTKRPKKIFHCFEVQISMRKYERSQRNLSIYHLGKYPSMTRLGQFVLISLAYVKKNNIGPKSYCCILL